MCYRMGEGRIMTDAEYVERELRKALKEGPGGAGRDRSSQGRGADGEFPLGVPVGAGVREVDHGHGGGGHGEGGVIMPLGGREADGFDQWLRVTAQTMRETGDDLRERLRLSNPMRYVAIEAAKHYAETLAAWNEVERRQDGRERDRFEVDLIAGVMSAYGAAEFARSRGYGPEDTTAGGRPMADVAAGYLRACIILAQYVGVSELDVHACKGDQAALMALGGARK